MSFSVQGLHQVQLDPAHFKGRDFLTLADYSGDELRYLLAQAIELKQQQYEGITHHHLAGQSLGMIFEKPSTRTRVSFEVGMYQLGGQAIFLSSKDLQLGRGESIEDTAKVLSRYLSGVMIRTFSHKIIEAFAEHADIPVVNGLTDIHHPVQVMADLQTIWEHKGSLDGLKLCYIGDGNNNMTHSLIEGAVKLGLDISIAYPEGYEPNQTIVQAAKQESTQTGSTLLCTTHPREAIEAADVVITDVWTSMGYEEEQAVRLERFKPYQINDDLCQYAKQDYLFLHCLPAHRGEEVSAEVIDGLHSAVFDEAENRLHAQKAILKALMSK
jgi:ornithine carbamoyltransferase